VHEGGVIQFVDWYADFMVPRLAEGGKPALKNVA
jgi:Rieske 2Fe-2S family protein